MNDNLRMYVALGEASARATAAVQVKFDASLDEACVCTHEAILQFLAMGGNPLDSDTAAILRSHALWVAKIRKERKPSWSIVYQVGFDPLASHRNVMRHIAAITSKDGIARRINMGDVLEALRVSLPTTTFFQTH